MKLVLPLLLAAGAILAQPNAEFYTLSIRPHGDDSRPIVPSFTVDGNTYRAVGVTLWDLVSMGYRKRTQILGLVGWMLSDRFDIEAKASGDGTPAWNKARPALRAMLGDRFKLQVRHEQRAEPAYDLLVANGGPRFTEHTDPAWFNPRFNV